MAVDYPDGAARRLHDADAWREKLDQVHCRYSGNRTEENRAAYLKALKTFADLVLRNQPPPDSE